MKRRLVFSNLLLLALSLVLVPTTVASSTWYVDGVHGSDNNNCKSRQHACKTIGHGVSLAHSGDSIMVAAAIYTENLAISFSLKVVGSGAQTTIIDGGGVNTVVTISNASAHITLSKLTIRNGLAVHGGGINNSGTLTISNSTVSGNTASGNIAALGGGIFNSGTLTIANSTVNTNSAIAGSYSAGGGIFNGFNGGSLTINNSTITGNSASTRAGFATHGGGISNPSGTLTINNGTLSGNRANHSGGGISNGGTATLQKPLLRTAPRGETAPAL
jgi:hypothetical protein